MFRHLRSFCDTGAPKAPGAADERPHRLVVTCSYVGHAFYGFGRNTAEDEEKRPTVEGALLAAMGRAWGEDTVISSSPAVYTEKLESARRNVLVVGVRPPHLWAAAPATSGGGAPSPAATAPAVTAGRDLPAVAAAALKAQLPRSVALLAPPRLLAPSQSAMAGIARAVARREHAFAVPYSILVASAGGAPGGAPGNSLPARPLPGAGGRAAPAARLRKR